MKRGITAIIIVMFCTISAITVNIISERKAQSLYSFALSATNNKDYAAALEAEWNREAVYFALFTEHDRFEIIGKKIRKLRYLNGEDYRNLCTETAIDLLEFKEHLSYSLPNIF